MKEFLRSIILKLLTLEARAVLKRYRPKIILVTGSVGKTSSKDAIFTALKREVFVRKSEKSFNSDIGVPLTILGLPNGWSNIFAWLSNLLRGLFLVLVATPYPKWLVIEVGADRPGDISESLSWLKPDVVVTTRFPDIPVHVEFYESPEEVFKEELHPLSLLTTNGIAVLNYDDERTMSAPLPQGVTRITYGFKKGADVRALRYRATSRKGAVSGISFEVTYNEEKQRVVLPKVIGHGHAYAVLAGIAGALATGVSLEAASSSFEGHATPPGRLRIIEGAKGAAILDDSYNSSPVAAEEALNALSSVPCTGKRIAVLGDMLELGVYSTKEHERIGEYVVGTADVLVAVGVRSRAIAEGAKKKGMQEVRVHTFDRTLDTTSFLLPLIEAGDVVLIKGSQGMRMERITKALMAEPQEAAKLLPRQDSEWLAR